MADTTKDIIGPGYTTHGDNGVTYSTTPNMIGDGSTTVGSDGSEYVTTKNILNDGYTITKTKDPRPVPGDNDDKNKDSAAGDLGAGVILAVVAVVLFTIAGGILTPMTYVWIAAFALAPAVSGMPEDKEETALTLNGKKSRLNKADFISLAEKIGVNERAAQKIIKSVLDHKDDAMRLIEGSYLDDKMKAAFSILVEERVERLKSQAN